MNSNKNKRSIIKRFTLVLVLLLLILTILYVQALFTIPSELLIINGEDYICNFKSPVYIGLLADKQGELRLNGRVISSNGMKLSLFSPFTLRSNNVEKVNLKLKLFGIIPLKTMVVDVVPNKAVIPCGNTVGVKIYTIGVLVVGTSQIDGADGRGHEPYLSAGIKPGDYIIEINNKEIKGINDVVNIMDTSTGQPLTVKLNRNNNIIKTIIKPVKSQDNIFKMGLWLRDSTAGIGTMTFYDPETKIFGALGHGITDVDTGTLMKIDNGEILNSNIINVKKGLKGSPGELRGVFLENGGGLGRIIENSECGIFGKITNDKTIIPQNNNAIPIAIRTQIKEGPAQIISNISGSSTNVYNIDIQKIYRNNTSSSKSMIVKITDERLLNYTGGIVQGMSGSPIIQNGRLVGAITHVLVNDPTRGYGVFIEWMIEKIHGISEQSLKNAS